MSGLPLAWIEWIYQPSESRIHPVSIKLRSGRRRLKILSVWRGPTDIIEVAASRETINNLTNYTMEDFLCLVKAIQFVQMLGVNVYGYGC